MKFTQEHEEIRRTMKKFIDAEINPHVDDGIIDPRGTRNVPGFALSIVTSQRDVRPVHIGVARP
jgi:hypothetical protein